MHRQEPEGHLTKGDAMKALAIAALAAAVILSGSPALAQASVDPGTGALAQTPVPAGTPEYDAYQAMLRTTLNASVRNWDRLQECSRWYCFSTYARRFDNVLTRGIQWMYAHPALPCYQEQQQRATKGFQEVRGAVRLLYRAVVLRSEWRIKVAFRKVDAANQIFQNLPVETCPA
jgi:hypothetical protein